jgi:hypothetical protein
MWRKVVQRVRSAVSLVMMGGGEDGIVDGWGYGLPGCCLGCFAAFLEE